MRTFPMTAIAVTAFVLTACAHQTTATTPQTTAMAQPAQPKEQESVFDTKPGSASEAFPTIFDGTSPTADIIAAGKYDEIDPRIAELLAMQSPPAKDGMHDATSLNFRLVRPDEDVLMGNVASKNGGPPATMRLVSHGSIDDVRALIDRKGLRPATARELFAFVAAHRDLLMRTSHNVFGDHGEVIALGTVWNCKKDDGSACAASVARLSDGRLTVQTYLTFIGPSSASLFLALPK